MFYSQDILQKRGGKFSKIWLAATKMSKLNRREVASIHVAKSCDDILEYVELRAQPGPRGKRPRFSLYLSALLMYGVVRIHQKQGEYLLEDVSAALIRICKSLPKLGMLEEIDLQTEMREDQVTNPEFEVTESEFQSTLEFLFLSDEELEVLLGRPDPEFWRMETSSSSSRSTVYGLLSPQYEIGSPQRPLAAGLPQQEPVPSPQREQFQPVVGSPHQVAREEITLQEPPPVSAIPEQVSGMDLPRLDGTELDMNLGVIDQPLTVQDLMPPTSTPAVQPREKGRKSRRRQDKDKQTEIQEAEAAQERTPERRPPGEVPEPRAVPPSPGVTLPVITSPLPKRQKITLDPLDLGESVSPTRRRRKRQLGFADAETQIPKAVLKRNFSATEDITQNFILPAAKPLSVSDLLNMPSGRDLKDPRHLPLWRRNAKRCRDVKGESETSESGSPSDVQPERAAGEQGAPRSPVFTALPLTMLEPQPSPVLPQPDLSGIERPSVTDQSVEALRQAGVLEDIEISAVEQARDISTSTLEPTEQISMEGSILDSGKKDASARKRRRTRSSAGTSLLEERDISKQMPSSKSASHILYDVQEEQEHRVPDAVETQPPPVPAQITEEIEVDSAQAEQTLLRQVRENLRSRDQEETTFNHLCPPALTSRKTAAVKFAALLDLCGQNRLRARQPVAYGDINISLVEYRRRRE